MDSTPHPATFSWRHAPLPVVLVLVSAALSWRSRRANAWGEPGSEVKAFASEAQTAPGHSEFIGTGGSLYYLKHTDILPGSDRVVLEVRDPTTGRVEVRVDLARGQEKYGGGWRLHFSLGLSL